jgi:hypothetical protein
VVAEALLLHGEAIDEHGRRLHPGAELSATGPPYDVHRRAMLVRLGHTVEVVTG